MSFVTNFSKPITIKNGGSGHYISTQSVAGFSLLFQFKKSAILIFHLDFCTKFTVVYVYWPIIRELQLLWQNAKMQLCTYLLLTLVQSLSQITLMPIVLKHIFYSILWPGFRKFSRILDYTSYKLCHAMCHQ